MQKKSLLYFFVALAGLCILGWYDSPFEHVKRETDIRVDPEYMNGMLAASGFLFGAWAIVLEKKPEKAETERDKTKKWLFDNIVKELFFLSFAFLLIDVLLFVFAAINAFSPMVTLAVASVTFFYNAIFLGLTLNSYIFKN